jgi:hypothetical protein
VKFKILTLVALNLLGLPLAYGQNQQETVQRLEEFFTQGADNLQDHLSVPLTDKAYYKRYRETYEALEQGLLPAKWREKLMERILALLNTSASRLTSVQQAVVANSLNTLANSSSSPSEAAEALKALQNTLGISSEEAGLFGRNKAMSATLLSNAQAAFNNMAANEQLSNSLVVPQINSPAQVNYSEGGPVTGIATQAAPPANTLLMSNFASVLGEGNTNSVASNRPVPQTPSAAPRSTSNTGGTKTKEEVLQHLLKGLSRQEEKNKITQDTSHSKTNLFGANHYLATGGFTAPLRGNTSSTAPATHPTSSNPRLTEIQDRIFGFDPMIAFGGEIAKTTREERRRTLGVDAASASVTTPNNSETPARHNPSPKAGYGLAQAQLRENYSSLTKICDEALQKQLLQDKVLETRGSTLTNFSKAEEWVRKWRENFQIKPRRQQNMEDWIQHTQRELDQLTPTPTPPAGQQRTDTDSSLQRIQRVQKLLDDEFAIQSMHLNNLALTPDLNCVLSQTSNGLFKEDCHQYHDTATCDKMFNTCNAFANVPAGKSNEIPLADHMKMMSLVEFINHINGLDKATAESDHKRQLLARLRDLKTEDDKSIIPSDNLFSWVLSRQVEKGRNHIFTQITASCDNEGSWAKKIQTLELQLRNALFESPGCFSDPNEKQYFAIQLGETFGGDKFKQNLSANPSAMASTPLPILSSQCKDPSQTKELSPSSLDEIKNKFPDYFNIKSPNKDSSEWCNRIKKAHVTLLDVSQRIFESCSKDTQQEPASQKPLHSTQSKETPK